jgi:hypothetical protein
MPVVREMLPLEVMVLMASRTYTAASGRTLIGMPFVPSRFDDDAGCWRFECLHQRYDGLCDDYEHRPIQPCVAYQVRQCSMCALWSE